jgi:hypothetical protein
MILLSHSDEAGLTWSAPIKVNETPSGTFTDQAWEPAVHVNNADRGDLAAPGSRASRPRIELEVALALSEARETSSCLVRAPTRTRGRRLIRGRRWGKFLPSHHGPKFRVFGERWIGGAVDSYGYFSDLTVPSLP